MTKKTARNSFAGTRRAAPAQSHVPPHIPLPEAEIAPHLFKKWVGDRDAVTRVKPCDNPNCGGRGEYRAPKSRLNPDSYYWFCLEHVTAYNAAWDYYKGMTVEQIEEALRYGSTWERPTWPLGNRHLEKRVREAFRRSFAEDAEDAGSEEFAERVHAKASARGVDPRYIAQLNALRELGLAPPVDFEGIKKRYRDLVKRHHPDVQGGQAEAEEKLKRINSAFTILKIFYADESVMNSEG